MSQSKTEQEIWSLKLTVGVYIFVFVIKIAAYLMTHVMALLAEGLHTLSDLFISIFLLTAVLWSRKNADEAHRFGHGRAQNVAALLAATLFISFTSYKLYEESIPKLFSSEVVHHENLPVAIGVLIVSIVIAAAPLISLWRQKSLGAAARAQFLELINDELGLAAALIGTILISLGFPLADPLAAIAVATIIAFNAIKLFRENIGLVVGQSPGPEIMSKLEQLAMSVEGVKGVHKVRAEYVGPDVIHADLDIEVQRGITIEEANAIGNNVFKKVDATEEFEYCTVHVDPERPKPEKSEAVKSEPFENAQNQVS